MEKINSPSQEELPKSQKASTEDGTPNLYSIVDESDKEDRTASVSKSDPEVATTTEPEQQYITGIKLYAVLVGLTLVLFLVMLDQTIIATAIPTITNDFNSLKDIGWYGGGYLLTLASLQPLSGKIYQYYNSKVAFLIGVFIFELGSLISGVARSSAMLIVGRAISGVGGSGLLTGFLAILAASAPLTKRPMYMGIVMGLASLGLVLGPVLGGVFTEHATWRWCFYINLPIGAITSAILLFIRVPDSQIETDGKPTWKGVMTRLDLVGFAIFLPSCLMLLLALQWGGVTYSWSSAIIIGLFCGSGVSFIIFLLWERSRGAEAMVPLKLLRNTIVACAVITSQLSSATFIVQSFYLPLWFQAVKGVGPTLGGIYYFASIGGVVFGSVVTGALTTRLGYYTPFAIGGCALAAIAAGLYTILTPTSSAVMWAGFQVISGIGRGATIQQPLTAVQLILPKKELAVGNSLILFSQTLAGALFIPLAQTMFSNELKHNIAHFAPEVNADAVLAVGATDFRRVVDESSIHLVVLAYNKAITVIFYLGLGASCVSFATSWGLGWTNLKKKKEMENETTGTPEAPQDTKS